FNGVGASWHLEGHVAGAQRFGHRKLVVEILVGILTDIFHCVDAHARIVVHLAQILEDIHRQGEAPFPLSRNGCLLLRRLRTTTEASTAATSTAATGASALRHRTRHTVPLAGWLIVTKSDFHSGNYRVGGRR